jgi:hypothetical protein
MQISHHLTLSAALHFSEVHKFPFSRFPKLFIGIWQDSCRKAYTYTGQHKQRQFAVTSIFRMKLEPTVQMSRRQKPVQNLLRVATAVGSH